MGQKRYGEAETLLRGLSEDQMARTPEDPTSILLLVKYAQVLEFQAKDLGKQESLLRRAYDTSVSRPGSDERSIVLPSLFLGRFYMQRERFHEAEPLLRKAYSITRTFDLPLRQAAREYLVSFYEISGQTEKAAEVRMETLKHSDTGEVR